MEDWEGPEDRFQLLTCWPSGLVVLYRCAVHGLSKTEAAHRIGANTLYTCTISDDFYSFLSQLISICLFL